MLKETIFYTDFNDPHWDGLMCPDGKFHYGPEPLVGDMVTLCDFSEEFYCNARVTYVEAQEEADEKRPHSGCRVVYLDVLRDKSVTFWEDPNWFYEDDYRYETPPEQR